MKMRDELAWSYPWFDNFNCIQGNAYGEIFAIGMMLGEGKSQQQALYEIYRNGVENCRNYHIDNYIPNYVLDSIASALNDL